jgi:hypothetical protein
MVVELVLAFPIAHLQPQKLPSSWIPLMSPANSRNTKRKCDMKTLTLKISKRHSPSGTKSARE